jgi:hypothetical protein
MSGQTYRIESESPIVSPLLPESGHAEIWLDDGELAVVVAAKSHTVPGGREIRVVHVPTGEVVFRKADERDREPVEGGGVG